MKRITLSGYYGFENAGDEAVLAGLIYALRSLSSGGSEELVIDALSIDPARTRREHGISSSHRYRAAGLVRAIAGCDLLASGGGSLLQDVTSRHSIYYYLGVVRAAQILGKRTMFVAQGIGPLTRPRSRRLAASVAGRCDAISVRDAQSAALLAEIGVDTAKVQVTADPALLLAAESQGKRGVAVSLRSWPAAPGIASCAARALKDALEVGRIALPLLSPDDAEVMKEFNAALAIEPQTHEVTLDLSHPMSWRQASAAFAGSEVVIGMRLHALILAAASGVPSVALAYDPKVAAFMHQTGQEDAVFDVREPDAGRLAELIRRVWDERDERAARLRDRLPLLRAAAEDNAKIALSLLERDCR